jgi:hypothetical protein
MRPRARQPAGSRALSGLRIAVWGTCMLSAPSLGRVFCGRGLLCPPGLSRACPAAVAFAGLALAAQEKARYKDAFGQLRELKKEIEHLHLLLEQSRTRLQRDFEQWMGLMLRQQQQAQQAQQQAGGGFGSPGLASVSPAASVVAHSPHAAPAGGPRSAWGEPPARSQDPKIPRSAWGEPPAAPPGPSPEVGPAYGGAGGSGRGPGSEHGPGLRASVDASGGRGPGSAGASGGGGRWAEPVHAPGLASTSAPMAAAYGGGQGHPVGGAVGGPLQVGCMVAPCRLHAP